MIIKLSTYTNDNQDAILDSEKSFDEQTQVCKDYINSKQNSTEHKPLILDDNNRPSTRINYFAEGFAVEFHQNYKNSHNYLIDSETVTLITV